MDYLWLALIGAGLLYTGLSLWYLAFEINRREDFSDRNTWPGISVFKPLKGLDDNLEANLRTFLVQDYRDYELIFGVNDEDDPAIELIRKLQAEYPEIKSRLVIDTHRSGYNPKVNNLCNMYKWARYDCLVISDSNVRVKRDYLRDLIANLDRPGVGMVTSLIRGTGARSLGAILENVHLNSFIASSIYTVHRLFRVPVTIGKSMCFRRETLERLGGFERFREYLIEDALLGQEISDMGLKIAHTSAAIENVNNSWSLRHFANRHVRWATMRRHLNLVNYAAEIVSNPIMLAFVYLLLSRDVFSLAVFISVAMIKTILDAVALRLTGSDGQWYHPLWVPVKDLIMGFIWAVPFLRRRVVWRGNHFLISGMTRVTPAPVNGSITTVARIANAYILLQAYTSLYLSNSINFLSRWTQAMTESTRNGTRRLIARFSRV